MRLNRVCFCVCVGRNAFWWCDNLPPELHPCGVPTETQWGQMYFSPGYSKLVQNTHTNTHTHLKGPLNCYTQHIHLNRKHTHSYYPIYTHTHPSCHTHAGSPPPSLTHTSIHPPPLSIHLGISGVQSTRTGTRAPGATCPARESPQVG